MVQTINGRLAFVYAAPRKQPHKPNIKLSLAGVLLGIFLLPNLAHLSDLTPEKIISLTNQQRQTAGLNDLTASQLLTEAALAKSQAILKSQTFSHTIGDKRFSSWVRDTGYNYSYVGENLALDFATSEGLLQAWDNSPLHQKNLLSPYYQEIGVAAASGKFQGQDTTVVVQIFGAPATASVQPLYPNLNQPNLKLNLPEINLAGSRFPSAENLLTHSVIGEELLPASAKLILPAQNAARLKANKIIVQPAFYTAGNNFMTTFASLTLIYLLIFLYYYYFFKINKLASL